MSDWVRNERSYFRLDPSPLCPLLGVAVPVDIHTGEGEIEPDQLEAAARFLAIPADRRRSLYTPLFADYREAHGWTGAGPHIGGPEEVWALVRWNGVLVPRQGPTGHRFVFVEGRPAWEVEHGVELLFRDEQVVHVGRAEGAFRGRFWEWLGHEQAEPGPPPDTGRGQAEPGPPPGRGRSVTEAEWLACADPTRLLLWERIPATGRQLRLFAVACCRRIPALDTHAALAAVVDTAERFADRLAGEEDLRAAHLRADGLYDGAGEAADDCQAAEGLSENTVRWQAIHCAARAAYWASLPGELRADIDSCPRLAADAVGLTLAGRDYEFEQVDKGAAGERAVQADLFRDIFGNPFRPVDFPASWRTDAVASVAGHIYDSRDFSVMPILADALQDAGCDSEDILGHCRAGGPHVRGCWVVDVALART